MTNNQGVQSVPWKEAFVIGYTNLLKLSTSRVSKYIFLLQIDLFNFKKLKCQILFYLKMHVDSS